MPASSDGLGCRFERWKAAVFRRWRPPSGVGPTWASDVSPALKQFRERKQSPFTTGSSIEKSIRTVPPHGAILSAPSAAEQGIVVPVASQKNSNAPVGAEGVTQ